MRELVRFGWLAAFLLASSAVALQAISGCEGEVISRPDDALAPATGPSVIDVTWDPEDSGHARFIPSEGRIAYEVCWSDMRERFGLDGITREQVAYNSVVDMIQCIAVSPDTMRASIEIPDGHWYMAVRAVYRDATRGEWRTSFSNVIEVRTAPQIARPIEEIP